VDPVELGLNDYFEVIKKPMDLGTIKKKSEAGCYHDLDQFKDEVLLCFENAMTYNAEKTPVYNMAVDMRKAFQKVRPSESERSSIPGWGFDDDI
jgi:E1A/CREB-binding protein